MSILNSISSGASLGVNTYISPRYSVEANRDRAPGQPTPGAFAIWFPIYAGQIAYGLLPRDRQTARASAWNHAIALSGLAYSWTLMQRRYFSMQAMMGAMTFSAVMYRLALGAGADAGVVDEDALSEGAVGDSAVADWTERAVKFTAELGVGWLAAADLIVLAQNTRRLLDRGFTHREQHAVGAVEAIALTGAAVASNHVAGWSGVSAAAAWALSGIALDQKSEKHVRAIAGVAAAAVVADLAWKAFGSGSGSGSGSGAVAQSSLKAGRMSAESSGTYAVIVEDTFIAPNMMIEEVTTVRL